MRLETRLHRARIDRGIDLTDLATRTRLSPHVLRKIDEGRFAELPAGVYARAYVRAFAAEVGLQPEEAVQELEAVLPPAEDPLNGLREAVRRSPPAPGSARARAARAAAAVLDAAVLLAIDALFVQLIAAACDVDVITLLEQAGAVVSLFCAIPVALYFIVFDGVGGRTPGAWLCQVPAPDSPAPLRLRTIFMRTVRL